MALFLGLLFFGGLIEILQSFTTYRFAEWIDWIADGVGVLAGYLLNWVLCRRSWLFLRP
jgi:VanZ family protein